MIEALRYLPISGNLEIRIDGHRHVLESAKILEVDEGMVTYEVKDSDTDNEDPFISSVFSSVKGEIPDSTIRSCDYLPKYGVIKVDGKIITPDDDLSNRPVEVKNFAGAVFTEENNALFESLKSPFETEPVVIDEVVDDKDGNPVLTSVQRTRVKMVDVQVRDDQGKLLFTVANGKETPVTVKRPVKKAGISISG